MQEGLPDWVFYVIVVFAIITQITSAFLRQAVIDEVESGLPIEVRPSWQHGFNCRPFGWQKKAMQRHREMHPKSRLRFWMYLLEGPSDGAVAGLLLMGLFWKSL